MTSEGETWVGASSTDESETSSRLIDAFFPAALNSLSSEFTFAFPSFFFFTSALRWPKSYLSVC